jgi:Flp pilus assembly protein TadD
LFNQKKYQEAEAEFRTAAKLEPENAAFRNNVEISKRKRR